MNKENDMMNEWLELTDEDGNVEEYLIIEETKLGGFSYILVVKNLEEGEDAFILKDLSGEDDEEAQYIFVEDQDELKAVADIFNELVEEIELE